MTGAMRVTVGCKGVGAVVFSQPSSQQWPQHFAKHSGSSLDASHQQAPAPPAPLLTRPQEEAVVG